MGKCLQCSYYEFTAKDAYHSSVSSSFFKITGNLTLKRQHRRLQANRKNNSSLECQLIFISCKMPTWSRGMSNIEFLAKWLHLTVSKFPLTSWLHVTRIKIYSICFFQSLAQHFFIFNFELTPTKVGNNWLFNIFSKMNESICAIVANKQGVIKRCCRLSLLTNSALVYESKFGSMGWGLRCLSQ